MSAVPSTPSTPGRASAMHRRSQQVSAVGHRDRHRPARRARPGPGGRRRPSSAGRAAAAAVAAALAGGRRVGRSPRGSRDPGLERRPADVQLRHRPASSQQRPRPRPSVGIAVEHSRREATIAPAAFANRSTRSQRPPGEQPVAQRAAEPVAGAETVDDLDRDRRHLDGLVVRVRRQHALRALLDDGELDARGRAAHPRRARGSRSPMAIAHSSRLPTATVTCGSARADLPARPRSRDAQNIGR